VFLGGLNTPRAANLKMKKHYIGFETNEGKTFPIRISKPNKWNPHGDFINASYKYEVNVYDDYRDAEKAYEFCKSRLLLEKKKPKGKRAYGNVVRIFISSVHSKFSHL
jgi:hypothetical protein